MVYQIIPFMHNIEKWAKHTLKIFQYTWWPVNILAVRLEQLL